MCWLLSTWPLLLCRSNIYIFSFIYWWKYHWHWLLLQTRVFHGTRVSPRPVYSSMWQIQTVRQTDNRDIDLHTYAGGTKYLPQRLSWLCTGQSRLCQHELQVFLPFHAMCNVCYFEFRSFFCQLQECDTRQIQRDAVDLRGQSFTRQETNDRVIFTKCFKYIIHNSGPASDPQAFASQVRTNKARKEVSFCPQLLILTVEIRCHVFAYFIKQFGIVSKFTKF